MMSATKAGAVVDDGKVRCGWVDLRKPYYIAYHDEEWGRSVHDDRHHFELLCLEGAQCGLSWDIILRKRAGYKQAFRGFDPSVCASLSDEHLDRVVAGEEGDVVKNRAKVWSVRKNAAAFLEIVNEFGSFDHFVWQYVDGVKIVNTLESYRTAATKTEVSDRLAKDLKQRGMSFLGSTTVYAYLQAAGLVNDHEVGCFCHADCCGSSGQTASDEKPRRTTRKR
jgi:DNA-3-methyladenine glycosylase I